MSGKNKKTVGPRREEDGLEHAEMDDEVLTDSESQQDQDPLPDDEPPGPFPARDRFLVPLDAKGCFYCEQKECARVFVRVFIPGTNSRGIRNHYDHPQNKAILPICKSFFDQLQSASCSGLPADTERGRTRPYIILANAGVVFQKYYLPTVRCTRYFYHIKRVRLAHRFEFAREERTLPRGPE